jgi:hypothetical protein
MVDEYKQKFADWYFCINCKPKWELIGEFNELYFLVRDTETNQFLIGDASEHAYAIYTFPVTPTRDPLNITDEMEDGNDPMYDKQSDWITNHRENENTFVFAPTIGWELYEAFTKSGWRQDVHGDLFLYIIHHAAVLIENHEQRIAKLHPNTVG